MERTIETLSRQQRRWVARANAKKRSQFNGCPINRYGEVCNRKQRRKWAAERRAK